MAITNHSTFGQVYQTPEPYDVGQALLPVRALIKRAVRGAKGAVLPGQVPAEAAMPVEEPKGPPWWVWVGGAVLAALFVLPRLAVFAGGGGRRARSYYRPRRRRRYA